jgi:ketosteroid isomerase-like protein
VTLVTGREEPIDPREPLGALREFYRAFNTRDLVLMERNWASSDEACMAHPIGGVRYGWDDIRQVYERIFRAAATVNIEFRDFTLHHLGDTFYAVGREQGVLQGNREPRRLQFRTSRLFRFIDGRWRQVHHHGSIEDPVLMAWYKAAIR